MMLHRIFTEPEVEPVSLAEMRQHLGITQATDTSRDEILTARIKSARIWCENSTRKQFIYQTWTGFYVNFTA